jgi:hypothetical protein
MLACHIANVFMPVFFTEGHEAEINDGVIQLKVFFFLQAGEVRTSEEENVW